jgi:hypothetical protein
MVTVVLFAVARVPDSVEDVRRSVTTVMVRDARMAELKKEVRTCIRGPRCTLSCGSHAMKSPMRVLPCAIDRSDASVLRTEGTF